MTLWRRRVDCESARSAFAWCVVVSVALVACSRAREAGPGDLRTTASSTSGTVEKPISRQPNPPVVDSKDSGPGRLKRNEYYEADFRLCKTYVERVSVSRAPVASDRYDVYVHLTGDGRAALAAFTEKWLGRVVCVRTGGEEVVCARVSARIASGVISAQRADASSAARLADAIRAVALAPCGGQ